MEPNDDPYAILGISADATSADIKKAYRKLALKNHPDKQSCEPDRVKASDLFAKIAAAYEILSDDEERQQYDLRKKHGGAPGTRYKTYGDDTPQQTRTTSSNLPRTTFTRIYTSPKSSPRKQKTQTIPSPQSFQFSYDPSKTNASDPYAIFKEVFGKDFEKEFPGATMNQRAGRCPPSASRASPLSPTRNTNKKKVQQSTLPGTTIKKPQRASISTVATNRALVDNVVSMSSSTKTVVHDDGSHETIKETTYTLADGTTKSSRASSRTAGSSPQPVTRTKVIKNKSPKMSVKSSRLM